ncbi:MAG: dehydrogenase [Methylotenera sp.]|uniref:GHMP family kinase ATP-binding protein n=1 Tax=Methylotenera sp. TaxID=2051956 RepID=UPI001844F898|nr:dehydrogenase [Methylotenera sp.]NOU24894.1 dehydrogenase [Methylotenera sp.]
MNKDTSTIRARAPLRLGLAGGGTDVSPYSDDFGGLVLNVTIDKYAYATIVRRSDDHIEFIAADNNNRWFGKMSNQLERVSGLDLHVGVYNRIVKDFNNNKPLSISVITHSEAPPGSGLGSSSTMVVALVQAFCELLSLPLGEYEIAQLAYHIERNDLGLTGGKQDQYAATFGGLNFMEFYKDRVIVNPLRIKAHIKAELESSLVLFYTGVTRESAKIIDEQTKNVKTGHQKYIDALHGVKAEAQSMKEAILKADFEGFAKSMQLGWASKKNMAESITNPLIDEIYNAAIAAGAKSGKVSGAGGGGFMMFFVDPAQRPYVMRALSKFEGQVSTCNFTDTGTQSWRIG